MSRGGANNCTVELVHGGYIHLEENFENIAALVFDVEGGDKGWVRWKRLEGSPGIRQARGFTDVILRLSSVVGVYPLTSRSEHDTTGSTYSRR